MKEMMHGVNEGNGARSEGRLAVKGGGVIDNWWVVRLGQGLASLFFQPTRLDFRYFFSYFAFFC